MDYLNFVQELNACHAPAGNETALAKRLLDLISPHADDCRIDALGNLIVHKTGSGKRLMLSAHLDSVGLIITHICPDGSLRVGKLGTLALPSSLHTPFRFANGAMGALVSAPTTKETELGLTDLYLDIGAKNKTEAEDLVQLGDTAVCALPTFAMGSRLCGPFLDSRLACVLLLALLQRLENTPYDLYCVFAAQGELSARGAKTAAFAIEPDYALSIGAASADEPGNKDKHSGVALGSGAAIRVMDASAFYHPEVLGTLERLAEQRGISHQRDVLMQGGSDAGVLQRNRAGVLTGGIGFPCRYRRTAVETVETADISACADLLLAFCQTPLENQTQRMD